jgi:hypothetical protein
MIRQLLSCLLTTNLVHDFMRNMAESAKMFDKIIGYDEIKRTFVRSLNSEQPVLLKLSVN